MSRENSMNRHSTVSEPQHRTTVAALALVALLAVPLAAQVSDVTEINPTSSNLNDANGASGGRINHLAVDPSFPNRIFAASEWGGIFRSEDGGDTWEHMDGHRPMATWDVAVDPGATFRVYATSFFDGKTSGLSQSGINVSLDNGLTWTRANATPPGGAFCATTEDRTQQSAFGIGIDPSNSTKVYIGTSCGLAVSNNSGQTWSYVKPTAQATRIWDVLVSSDGSKVDICGDSGHWTLTPPNSWQQGSGLLSGRCSLASSPYDDKNLFAAVGFSIFETENQKDWVQTRINPRPQGRIPFVVTNKRSGAPVGRAFDLWFGDFSIWQVQCDSDESPSCGAQNEPIWNGGFTRAAGAHDDTGDLIFDPVATNDACPTLIATDGGAYINRDTTSPFCHFPSSWDPPTVTPRALWPLGMGGVSQPGAGEDLYFANQDNGVFGTLNADDEPPNWNNGSTNKNFDAAPDSDDGSIVYTQCCFTGGRRTRVFNKGPKFAGGGEIPNYPTGTPPEGKYPDLIANWGPNKYVMVTQDFGNGFPPDGGVWLTNNINAGIVAWLPLHTSPLVPNTRTICGIKVGVDSNDVPTFFAQAGSCNADSTTDRVWRYVGATVGGTWTELSLPGGEGFGLIEVNRNDPQRVVAVGFTELDANPYLSIDGGDTWSPMPALKIALQGAGNFPMKNTHGPTDFTTFDGYLQPSLGAFDPNDSRIMVAGGRDSGVHLSTDGGSRWTTVTDPLNSHTSGIPHIPRPRFAYFDHESGAKSVYIGSQGRGVWRLDLESNCPPNVTVMNTTYTGTESVGASNTLSTGVNVVVQNGASPTLQAGQRVSFGNGLSVFGNMTVFAGGLVFCEPSAPVQIDSDPQIRGRRR